MKKKGVISTFKKYFKASPVLFVAITLTLSVVMFHGINYGISYILNLNNDHPFYTLHFSLGKLGVFLVIPAVFLTILIMKIIFKGKEKVLSSRKTTIDQGQKIVSVNQVLNSQTNYTGENKFYNGSNRNIKRKSNVIIIIIFNVCIYFFKGIYKLLNNFSNGISNSVNRNVSNWISNMESTISTNHNRQKVKNAAQWQARQKQKEADHAWNQAEKQANYNMNTRHFDEKLNRADRIQREADKMDRDSRNL